MKIKKRGIGQTALVIVIISLAIGLLLGGLIVVLDRIIKSSTDLEACRLSVLANSKLKVTDLNELIGIDCPKKELEITKSDIRGAKSDEEKQNKIKAIIAEEMKDCWWKTGAGELNPFSKALTEDVPFCILCAQITFDEGVQEEVEKISNLFPYLAMTRMPGKEITYYEYISKQVLTEASPSAFSAIQDEFSTEDEYSVLYYIRQTKDTSTVGAFTGISAGLMGLGVVTGVLWILPVPGSRIVASTLTSGLIAKIGVATVIGTGAYYGYSIGAKMESEDPIYSAIQFQKYQNVPKLGCVLYQ